ncbi:MAG: family 10 glycosylhydrolase [Nitrospiraceae bacterium]|nr:family 10 glycosylhydrolase [Nitrospiraceae bacterium]
MILVFVWTMAVAAAPQESDDAAAFRKLRKEAAHRRRRIIFDNDGNEPVYYMDEPTADALLEKRTKGVLGSHVDTIVYCTWSSGFSYFTHNTKVGVVFDCTAEEPGKGPGSGFSKNKTRALIDQGTDPLDIMVDYCRANDIEVFWSMRMNDVHDAWGAWYSPFLFPPLKKEHPDWLMGTKDDKPENGGWSAVDYGRPEIRDLAFKYIEEVCTNYDVDGVQLDFFRHLNYFRSHAMGKPIRSDEVAMMTDLLRRIRTMADDVGQRRGRPILISVRVPDSVAFSLAVGLDIEGWMAGDLIDLLVVGGYFRLNPWESSVELAHKYDVPVYPCLSESRLKDEEARKMRGGVEAYRARAMNAWDAGVDGIYMFNFFNPASSLWHELGDPKTLARLNKTYTTTARGFSSLEFWYKDGWRFMNRLFVTPDTPLKLSGGVTSTVDLRVGEDVPVQAPPKIFLHLRCESLDDAGDLVLSFNDVPLSGAVLTGEWVAVLVPPPLVKKGNNVIGIALKDGCPEGSVVKDVVMRVKYE